MADFGALTEPQARAYLEQTRWPFGIRCPFCQSKRIGRVQGGRKGLYLCNACRKQFTVTVGTIMERSHIPLNKWLYAFYLMSCSKKGISTLQLQRMLGLGSYKCAWHLSHRIRRAMRSSVIRPMHGVVEADETYVGGRGKNRPKGRSPLRKAPVLAVVGRQGMVYAQPIRRASRRYLGEVLQERVDAKAILMTDEWTSYKPLGEKFARHGVVKHSSGEYVNADAHVNKAESFFALLKRGIMGSYHHVSKQHLSRYCDEFSFRWNFRTCTDQERTKAALAWTVGKRLYYQSSNGHEALIRQ